MAQVMRVHAMFPRCHSDKLDALKKVPLFSGLSSRHLDPMADMLITWHWMRASCWLGKTGTDCGFSP